MFLKVITPVQNYKTFCSSTTDLWLNVTARPVTNSEDKQIWDSKAGEKVVPEAALKQLVPQLYLSLEAF